MITPGRDRSSINLFIIYYNICSMITSGRDWSSILFNFRDVQNASLTVLHSWLTWHLPGKGCMCRTLDEKITDRTSTVLHIASRCNGTWRLLFFFSLPPSPKRHWNYKKQQVMLPDVSWTQEMVYVSTLHRQCASSCSMICFFTYLYFSLFPKIV